MVFATMVPARLWAAVIALLIIAFGIALIVGRHRVAENMRRLPFGSPQHPLGALFMGLVFAAVGVMALVGSLFEL